MNEAFNSMWLWIPENEDSTLWKNIIKLKLSKTVVESDIFPGVHIGNPLLRVACFWILSPWLVSRYRVLQGVCFGMTFGGIHPEKLCFQLYYDLFFYEGYCFWRFVRNDFRSSVIFLFWDFLMIGKKISSWGFWKVSLLRESIWRRITRWKVSFSAFVISLKN